MQTKTQNSSLFRRISAAFIFSTLALASLSLLAPIDAQAQATYSTTSSGDIIYSTSTEFGSSATTTSSDSGETRTQRRERIRGYRQQSGAVQQQISALGGVAIMSVKMPVLFGVGLNNISPNFGDPRSGGRTHEGEDIMAVKGTPIVSPTAAVVLRTGVGETEGNFVYTANPGSETFVYMHLDKIGEGVVSGKVLAAGDLIGYVGNTGNAAGGPAHLHFEIHDSSNSPVDPFPRLTSEFSIQEKIAALNTVLAQTADSNALSQFLVTNFRSAFTAAISQNIALPQQITSALASIPASTVGAGNPIVYLPAGDLDIGSTGAAVITLQTYLIQSNTGASARALATAGATGYFGAITKAAVLEYQIAKGLSPADGYYGPATRAYVTSHPVAPGTTVTSLPPSPVITSTSSIGANGQITSTTTTSAGGSMTTTVTTNAPSSTSASTPVAAPSAGFARDLKLGMIGEDVRSLQKILNARGFTVALSGVGSSGHETNYFGPATQAAVIRFQISKGIVPAAGYFGPITRGILAAI